jgi:hypothetical protein
MDMRLTLIALDSVKKPITDLALLLFTSCLVIVGWYSIRSGERTQKDSERAYVFATPRIDFKQTTAGSGNIFVEIMLDNFGRTPATIKIIYGEAALTEPFGNIPVYSKGSARFANGALGPTGGTLVRAPVTFECPATKDFFSLAMSSTMICSGAAIHPDFVQRFSSMERESKLPDPNAFTIGTELIVITKASKKAKSLVCPSFPRQHASH